MLRESLEPDNLGRAVVFTVISLITAFPALAAFHILSNLWHPGHDNTAAVYILAGTMCLAAASIPAVFAVRVIWDASAIARIESVLLAAVAIFGFVLFMDATGKRNAQQHVEERRIESPSNTQPQPVAPLANPLFTPVATPSLGVPR